MPVRPLAVALGLLLLAGCAAPAATLMGRSGPNAAPGPRAFLPAVAMPQAGGGEPNIARLADGTLFVASPAGGELRPNAGRGAAFLWRSTDDGKTWDTLRRPTNPPPPPPPLQDSGAAGLFCSCDADVTTSPDGWVYYADWWISGGGLGPGNYLVEASPDGGATWSSAPVTIPENLMASVDREWIVAGRDGFVGLVYSFFGAACTAVACVPPLAPAFGLDRAGQAIQAVFSHDHGATWSDPVDVVRPSAAGLQIAHPFLTPGGTLLMPYGNVPATEQGTFWHDPSEVRLASSTDQGSTWTDTKLADAPLGFDNLWAVQGAYDAATGETTVVWAARLDGVTGDQVGDGSRMGLWVKQVGPLGDSAPVLVRGAGQNFLPWAAASHGRVAVGWYGGDATGDMTKAKPDAKWYAYAATAEDGFFTNATPVQRVDPDPVKTGPICPKGSACGGDRELLDYVSLVFDDDGGLHYAYTRSENGGAHVQVASQARAAG